MADSPEPREPFPWMSKDRSPGPYRFTLRHPVSEAVFGTFLLAAAGVMVASGLPLAVAYVAPTIFGALGVLLLVMAVARGIWLRKYRKLHGYSPFKLI